MKSSKNNIISFNQLFEEEINRNNKWVVMADNIPWNTIEKKYATTFGSHKGEGNDILRLALGSLAIQVTYRYSDQKLIEELTKNPYYQYFVGLPNFQKTPPINNYKLKLFRKKIYLSMIIEIKEYMESQTKELF